MVEIYTSIKAVRCFSAILSTRAKSYQQRCAAAIRDRIAAEVRDESLFWQVVSAGFAHPRKTILNNLRAAPEPIQELLERHGGASIVLCDAGIPPLRRAETFGVGRMGKVSEMRWYNAAYV